MLTATTFRSPTKHVKRGAQSGYKYTREHISPKGERILEANPKKDKQDSDIINV
jgi:hypothetical protein